MNKTNTKTPINKDCRYFIGATPCIWNKSRGYECPSCIEYSPRGKTILIIKLDAMGDVLRSTCIIPKIKERFTSSYLTWITRPESMELLASNPDIDETLNYNDPATMSRLSSQPWDVLYNLDNSLPSSSLASLVNATEKTGFLLKNNTIAPTNQAAALWLEMAVFDRVKQENEKSYQEIMYDICGFTLPIHRPCLHIEDYHIRHATSLIEKKLPSDTFQKPFVGIHTGAGDRWPKKMLGIEQIIKLIELLIDNCPDCYILLLGGPNETKKNDVIFKQIASDRVVNMECNHTLLQSAAIVKQCSVVLCADSLALHMATAMDIPAVALFGPTSYTEIYDYDNLIEKVKADQLDCLCCYGDCSKDQNCMTLISLDLLAKKIIKRILGP
jgi:heptosyltransferase-2